LSQIGLFDERPPPPAPRSFLDMLPDQVGDPDGLRYYQREAVEAILAALETNRSALLVLATGLGKTQVFAAIAKHWAGRVLVMAHRRELVDQGRKRIEQMSGEMVEVEQAQWRSNGGRVVMASTQTMYGKDRLAEFEADEFDLVVVDEAHHYVAPAYRRPLDYFESAKLIGVTATPDRTDEMALGKIFDEVAYVMDIYNGIQEGWLVPLECQEVFIDDVDLDVVGTNKGDLVGSQLDEAMLAGGEGIVKATLKYAGERNGIIFTPGVKTAHYVAQALNRERPGCAAALDEKTPDDERRQITRDFQGGRLQYLSNCMIATEGFDAPQTGAIIQARPTKSRSLYAQMIGRGTRTLDGLLRGLDEKNQAVARRDRIAASGKPNCLVLDCVGNNQRHDLVNAAEVLGGKYGEETVKRAKRKIREDGGDVMMLLEDAHAEMERAAKATRSRVKTRSRKFDPFEVLHVDGQEVHEYVQRFGFKPMSEGQENALKKFGLKPDQLKDADGPLSMMAATKLIGTCITRSRLGLASFGQLNVLKRHGIDDINLKFNRCSEAIDYLANNEWGKGDEYSAGKLHEILELRREPGEEG
jgi:superfamily II DNA or RNA helicase